MKNKELSIRVKETSILCFEGALLTKKFAELEKNLTVNMTKRIIHLVSTESFPKNWHFLPPDTHMKVHVSGG